MSAPDFVWPWEAPLDAAEHYATADAPFVLLHSASGGRYSFLALNPQSVLEEEDWPALQEHLGHAPPEARYFGYAAYELGALPLLDPAQTPPRASYLDLPRSWWMRPSTLLRFDHAERRIEGWGTPPIRFLPPAPSPAARCMALGSNASRTQYKAQVEEILADIRAGNYYQANLTRKFFGRLTAVPSALAWFRALCRISPAPCAALIHTPHWSVLSSSMEEFLRVEATGTATARPIKGTSARSTTASEDAALADCLRTSAKDRAENTMIVDLTRHDLAQVCAPGSVTVPALCALESYAQLHHLVSTVQGQLAPGRDAIDAVAACFPPGSMTGAPKRAAIRRLAALEGEARGPYSGVLGWLGAQEAHLSVVIRTLVLQGNAFEFQVGGGVVQDSTPEAEWRETLLKARGMAELLGIPPESLAGL